MTPAQAAHALPYSKPEHSYRDGSSLLSYQPGIEGRIRAGADRLVEDEDPADVHVRALALLLSLFGVGAR